MIILKVGRGVIRNLSDYNQIYMFPPEYIAWGPISMMVTLPLEIIDEYREYVDWDHISQYNALLDVEFISHYMNCLNLYALKYINPNLNQDVIAELYNNQSVDAIINKFVCTT